MAHLTSSRTCPEGARVSHKLARGVVALAAVGSTAGLIFGAAAGTPAAAASPSSDTSTYVPGTPRVATITNGTSQTPWNTSQGDPGEGAAYQSADLLPTYTPGGNTTSTNNGVSGATVTEPNVAVYPGASSGTSAVAPYPSGVVGTAGPLDGYCGSGTNTTEAAGTPSRQPAGTTLPFSPAYFPHVVRNADGSLTGYFDYRPEGRRRGDRGRPLHRQRQDWTYEGEALEQNPGYCPTADMNDDGQGHPNVITVGGTSYLYTLHAPAGDNVGVGCWSTPSTRPRPTP